MRPRQICDMASFAFYCLLDFLFIILPTKFHEGTFLIVLRTGCMSHSRKMSNTAMPITQVMP